MNNAERIKKAKEELGINNTELAALLRVTPEWISKILNSKVEGSPEFWERLEDVLRHWRIEHSSSPGSSIGHSKIEVNEAQASYGAVPQIRSELTRRFNELLLAAGDDRGRLGWIDVQMREHLSAPKSWRSVRLVPVSLPSQTQALDAETGKPVPTPSPGAQQA